MVLLPCLLWLLADFLNFFNQQPPPAVFVNAAGLTGNHCHHPDVEVMFVFTLRALHGAGFDPHVTE